MSDRFDVLERFAPMFEPPEPSLERFLRRRDRKRRNQRIAAGVVGIAVFLAAVWVVTSGAPFDRTRPGATGPTVPPDGERVGFIGLPPEGASPSTPARGDLVLSMWGRSTTDTGSLFRAWVYADGRLIWSKEGNLPYGANETTTGYLEQRLMPEGVDAMRSEVVSTGLFDRDHALLSSNGVITGVVRVRVGDGFVRLGWSNPDIYSQDRGIVATPDEASALTRIDALVTHPSSWLPSSAWQDEEIRPYVPANYAACVSAVQGGITPSRILQVLPSSVGDLLRANGSTDPSCFWMTTEDARTLVQMLDEAGVPRDESERDVRVSYRYEPPVALEPGPIENTVEIFIEPYFPHGAYTCSPCG